MHSDSIIDPGDPDATTAPIRPAISEESPRVQREPLLSSRPLLSKPPRGSRCQPLFNTRSNPTDHRQKVCGGLVATPTDGAGVE